MRRKLTGKLLDFTILKVMWKHTDFKHRINTSKLNAYLKEYGLKCEDRCTGNVIKIMREIGIDVRQSTPKTKHGVWIEKRPLSDENLKKIIFAVSTNPYITKEQATEILSPLKTFVTVYQEDSLVGIIEKDTEFSCDSNILGHLAVITEAIQKNRRIQYKNKTIKYHRTTESLFEKESSWNIFVPKYLLQKDKEIYLIGYDNKKKRVETINIKYITDVKIPQKKELENYEMITRILEEINPKEHLSGHKETVLYKGNVTFICHEHFVGSLYEKFGPPEGPIQRNTKKFIAYTVAEAKITPAVLHWIAEFEDRSIRLKGPEELAKCVREYCAECSEVVTDLRIPPTRGRRGS